MDLQLEDLAPVHPIRIEFLGRHCRRHSFDRLGKSESQDCLQAHHRRPRDAIAGTKHDFVILSVRKWKPLVLQ